MMGNRAVMAVLLAALGCHSAIASAFHEEVNFSAGCLSSKYSYEGFIRGASVSPVRLPELHIHSFSVQMSGTATVVFSGGNDAGAGWQSTAVWVTVYRRDGVASPTVASLRRQMGATPGRVEFECVAGVPYTAEVYLESSGSSLLFEGYSLQIIPPMPARTYTVDYSPGAWSSGSPCHDVKTQGAALTLLGVTYSRLGYTQTGWSEDSDGSTRDYGLSASYTVDADRTFYPYWTKNTYSVSYSLSGGSQGSTHPASATYDTAFSVSAPKKDGFVFKGWTVTSGLNASTAKWGMSSSPSTAIGSSLTVCANGAAGTVWFKNLTAQAGGSVTLTAKWATIPRPANDDFRNAALLSGSSGGVTLSNVDATAESGEPLVRRWSSAGTTVWWKWTAPSDGRVQFNTEGSSFDTVLGVYTGSSLSSLTKVTEENDDGPGLGRASKCEFSCVNKTCYYIAVGGYSGASGEIRLQWAVTSTVDITFDGNGATSGSMPRTAYEQGRVYALPKCKFWKSGKRFAGWRCSNGKRYDDGMLVFNLAKPGETVTMTAIWE